MRIQKKNTTIIHLPNMKDKILIIGAGSMAIEYAKVLKDLGENFIVVGRGQASADIFFLTTGTKVFTGGIERWLEKNSDIPQVAIVTVGEKELGIVARILVKAGIKKMLVEKPGGFDTNDIKKVYKEVKKNQAKVYVGYNRRFYSSVLKAQEIIKKDGGVQSFIFEFTEWGHKISQQKKDSEITKEWFLQNSTHVIDLAFYLCGVPKKISSYTAGSLDWHPRASIYAGAGVTKSGALFSYSANWASAGRWALEILTSKNRLILKPLEKLQIQKIGGIETNYVEIDDGLDQKYKPGIFREIKAFLQKNPSLPNIETQVKMLKFYNVINKSHI